jgi:hypothetical protein
MRLRTFSGEVQLDAVSANFVPGFDKARSVEVILTLESGETEILAELSPGTVFDIPYLRSQKNLRLTEAGRSIAEQFIRAEQSVKFKITSSYHSRFLEFPAQDLIPKSKAVASRADSSTTCASRMDGR